MASESTATAEPGTDPGTEKEPAPQQSTEPEGAGKAKSGEQSEDDSISEVEKWKELSRKNEKELRKAQSELDKIRESQMSEQEKAVAAARAEGAREVRDQTNRKLIEAEIRAAASGVLTDPKDALAMIGVDAFLPEGEDGEIDSAAIEARVAQLATEKPYLAVSTKAPPPGRVPGGSMDESQTTFTRQQLRDPEFYEKHQDEILKAAREGRITE